MSAHRKKQSLGARIARAFTRGVSRTMRDMGRELIPRALRRKHKGKGRSGWQTETVRRTRRPSRGGGGGGGLGGGNPKVDRALIESGWGPVRPGGRSTTGREPSEDLQEMGVPVPQEIDEETEGKDAQDPDVDDDQGDAEGFDPSSVEAGAV